HDAGPLHDPPHRRGPRGPGPSLRLPRRRGRPHGPGADQPPRRRQHPQARLNTFCCLLGAVLSRSPSWISPPAFSVFPNEGWRMSSGPLDEVARGLRLIRERIGQTPAGETLDWVSEQLQRPLPPLPLPELEAELDSLIGLESVKEQVRALTAFLQVQG